MRHTTHHTLLAAIFGALTTVVVAAPTSTPPTAESVKALTKKVADWQIKTFDEHGKHRALPTARERWRNNKNYHDLTWHMAALYIGMDRWRAVADQPEPYTDFLMKIGTRNGWKLHKRPYHADDHAVGQFYLSLYEEKKDPSMLAPTRERFDWILENPKTGSLREGRGTDWLNRWGWCDALFMSPPVWARLARITGERKYLDFMDQEYRATYDLLWDEEEKLFFRDSSFFEKRENNGEKIFWSRGNGWVFGGLAIMIPDLPADWEGRAFYIDLYNKMAARLLEIQRKDGTWSMGLLGDIKDHANKETSGTSFFTFGLAWGIREGLLDRETYAPAVFKAWNALKDCVTDEGMLGWVQPVGAAPGESFPDATEVYGIGAFLAAGAELYQLLSPPSKPEPSTN